MPYAPQRDRNPHQLELQGTPYPVAPLNLFLSSGYQSGVFDLCWDDPAQQALNSRFFLCGVNIYRSFDSEFGPYERITDLPLGATFWRDRTDNVLILDEVVEADQWTNFGPAAAELEEERFVFKTQRCPIVQPGSQNVPAFTREDVVVRIDGELARVLRVHGPTGEVEIDTSTYPDVLRQKLFAATRPGADSLVTVSYRYNRSFVRTDMMQRVFYRLTTVGIPVGADLGQVQSQDLVETPLERAAFTSREEIEKLDWIWREAVRRNQWILFEGGERVKLFIRKHTGVPCSCIQHDHHNQPSNDCEKCYGTGFLGGFEGPYDLIVAPDDAERRKSQKDIGRTVEHTYEVWTGPSPLLSQRDFIVKRNGERYSIGAVRMPTNRGMVLQQHFSIGHIDEQDIRYKVPMDRDLSGADRVPAVIPPQAEGAHVTEHVLIPDERELRGLTATWENITY